MFTPFVRTGTLLTVGPMKGHEVARLFLVERYWPGIERRQLEGALEHLDLAVLATTATGSPVAHVGSILMPADQVVLSVMRADSEEMVREVNEAAELPVDRISEISMHGFEADSQQSDSSSEKGHARENASS